MENQTLNKFTGLPEVPEVSTITGLPSVKRVSPGPGVQLQSQFNPQYRDPIASYQEYGAPLSPFLDLEEERAKRQSTAAKWGNGAAKMVTTAAGSFAEGTAGIIAGTIQAVGQQDGSKFWNNVVGNSVDDMNAWMQKNFPNYYTQEELNTKGLSSMGYANFWADKTLNGVGYMLGTIGSVAAGTGAVGMAGKAVKASSLASRLNKLTKAAVTGMDAERAANASVAATKFMDASKTAMVGMASAFAEASVEARETLRRTHQELLEEAAKATGVSVNELSAAEKQRAKEEATSAANLAFALNSFVVGVGNVVAYRNLLMPKYSNSRLGLRGIEKNSTTNMWENTMAKMTGKQKFIQNFGKPMARGAVVESFQEATQFAIQERAKEMNAAGSVSEMFDALGEGYVDTFSSKEGIDSALVGAVVGILGGGTGAVRRHYTKAGKEFTERQDATREKVIEILNNPDIMNAVKRAERLQDSANLSAQLTKALEEGDHKTYRDIQTQLLMNEILTFEEAGRMDLLYEKLDEELSKTDEQFRENWGIPEGTPLGDKNEFINGIKNRINQFVELKNKIDARYQAPTKPGKNATQEEEDGYRIQLAEYTYYREALLRSSFTIEDIDSRIENLTRELNEIGGITITKDELASSVTPEELQTLQGKLKDAFEKLTETSPLFKQDFGEKADDLVRLVADRAQAVKAVNQLTASPEERESYLEYLKQVEDATAQAERDSIAREKIEKAVTKKDLEDIRDKQDEDSPLSPSVKNEIQNKIDELGRRARKTQQEGEYKSVTDLEAELSETEDEVQKAILRDIIADRVKKGLQDPIKTRPVAEPTKTEEEKKPNTKELRPNAPYTAGKNETFSGEKFQVTINQVDANGQAPDIAKTPVAGYEVRILRKEDGEFALKDALTRTFDTFEEAKEYANTFISKDSEQFAVDEIDAEDTAKEVELFSDNMPATERSKERHNRNRVPGKGVSLANGELNAEGSTNNYKVVVSEDGDITTGNDANQKEPDGTPLNINRQALKEIPESELIGTPVTFRVIETEWSSNNEGVDDTNRPIGIYIQTEQGETLIGMVKEAETAERLKIARGEVTEGEITNVSAGNIISTVDERGNPIFFPAKEAIGDAEVVIGAIRDDGTVRVSKELREDDEVAADLIDDIPETKAAAGKVALISRKPGSGLGVKMANTADMDAKAVEAIKRLLQQNAEDKTDQLSAQVREIIGITNSQDNNTIFYIEKSERISENAFVYFRHANGDIVRFVDTELAKALNGENYTFAVGDIVPLTKEVKGETELVTDGAGYTRFKFEVKFDPSLEGLSEEEQAAVKKERGVYSNKMRGEMISSLENSLMGKKRQVDINKAYADRDYTSLVTGTRYDTYLDYLSSPEELLEPQQDKNAILSVDGKTHKGSFYYDLKVDIGIFEEASKPAEAVTPKAKQDVKNTDPKTEVNFGQLLSPGSEGVYSIRRGGGNTAKEKGEQNKKDCK